MGKVNSHMSADVRGFLAPLVNLAAEKRVAIVGIMHFNKKSDVTNAMLRIADSLAYVAAARHVYFVVDDGEVENRRLFVKAKNNLSADNKVLSYFTSAKMVGADEKTGKEIWAPYVQWGTEYVKVFREQHDGPSASKPIENLLGSDSVRYRRLDRPRLGRPLF
jgi:hypothetical protein